MLTKEEKLECLEKMEQANIRAERIINNLLSEGGLTNHQVLDALTTALICVAKDCEVPRKEFFRTINDAWDIIEINIEHFNNENTSIH